MTLSEAVHYLETDHPSRYHYTLEAAAKNTEGITDEQMKALRNYAKLLEAKHGAHE